LISIKQIKNQFKNNGNIMKTVELKAIGINSRQISGLLKRKILTKI